MKEAMYSSINPFVAAEILRRRRTIMVMPSRASVLSSIINAAVYINPIEMSKQGVYLYALNVLLNNLSVLTHEITASDSSNSPETRLSKEIIVINALNTLSLLLDINIYVQQDPYNLTNGSLTKIIRDSLPTHLRFMLNLLPPNIVIALRQRKPFTIYNNFVQDIKSPELVWNNNILRDTREIVSDVYEKWHMFGDQFSLSVNDYMYSKCLKTIKNNYVDVGDYIGGVFVSIYNENSYRTGKVILSHPEKFIDVLYKSIAEIILIEGNEQAVVDFSAAQKATNSQYGSTDAEIIKELYVNVQNITLLAKYIFALTNICKQQPKMREYIVTHEYFCSLIKRVIMDESFINGHMINTIKRLQSVCTDAPPI